jgi:hypothetical protein
MTINWKVATRVCWLVEVAWQAADESAQLGAWCGPPSLTGSGIAVHAPGSKTITAYEGRVSSLTISESMQELPESTPRIGTLSLGVQAVLGEEIHKQSQTGTWTGGTVRVWWYDLDTGDYEGAWEGASASEPEWSPDGFALSAEWRIGGLGSPIICTRLPTAASSWTKTTDYSGPANQTWNPPSAANVSGPIYPNIYGLHSEVEGKVLAPTWGQGADGWSFSRTGATPPDPFPGSWVECVIYGQKSYGGTPPTGPYYWIHVCPQTDVFVWDVLIDTVYIPVSATDFVTRPMLASDNQVAEVVTGINTDPTAGPVGTFVRLYVGYSIISGLPFPLFEAAWRDEQNLPRARVFCLVTGINSAGQGGANFDATDNPFLNTDVGLTPAGAGVKPSDHGGAGFGPDDPLTARDRLDQILEDIVTDADIITDTDSLYTGEPAAWWAARPASITGDSMTRRLGALAPELASKEPTGIDVLGAALAGAGACLVRRWDPTAGAVRWLPIWYGPEAGKSADLTLQPGHLQQARPPSLSGASARVYAVVAMEWAERVGQQYDGDGGGVPSGIGIPAFVANMVGAQVIRRDSSIINQVGPDERRVKIKYLHPLDPTPGEVQGYGDVADELLAMIAQRTTIIRADIGWQVAQRIPLGTLVAFDVPGLTAAVGQVRGWRVSPASGRATIEVWIQPR